MTADLARFLAEARALRQAARDAGDQAFGAVVVKDGRVVGRGPSRVVTGRDPSAHAEMEAIRDAARTLKTQDLSGCVLVSTSRPCPMCEQAAYWAHVGRMVHGNDLEDAGAPADQRC
ncbi:MAG: nucleoside deaminase [Rhodospirillaceae bacterium]